VPIGERPREQKIVAAGDAVQPILQQLSVRPAIVLIEIPDYIHEEANKQNLIRYFRAVGATEYAVTRFGFRVDHFMASAYKEATRKQDAVNRFVTVTGRYPATDDESDAFCIGWDYLAAQAAAQGVVQPRPIAQAALAF
jgi:hypothetical protein